MARNFTISSSSELLGISEVQVRDWTSNSKFIKPDYPAQGRGHRNEFSEKNLLQLKVFDKLVYAGIPRPAAAEVINHIDSYDLKKPFLCVERKGETVFAVNWHSGPAEVKNFDVVILINLEKIKKDIESAIR